ncbi:branched-chain amino acid ABC transporter permease [Maricaulis salignorans]|uniref:Amino acid/amide ABC transporter membrane protein 1, HAAT family n=1 Tax=Maricaulis salignorans TaxID=144026 RepID=A0A1G9LRJ2_9PROT|nr:branched-chain amino acid ABC transporter permease [Maricaulis salignorans]SDL64580.1 amino acid/amide ABC transporter membrane protein 1, HAAT family [Maricaulis salignorans]
MPAEFQVFLQQVVDGIANGSLYAAMAVAIVLAHRTTGVVNFALGEMALVCTFLAWQLAAWGAPLPVAIIAALVFAFVLGAGIERVLMRPLRNKPPLASAVVALGVFLVLNQVCALIWPGAQREFPALVPALNLEFAGVRIGSETLLLIAVLAGQAALLWWFFRHTRLGLRMRAASDNPESAVYIGIEPNRLFTLGWGLSAIFAAMAGILLAPSILLTTGMMFPILIYGLCAATLGGLNNPFGAIVGGILVGVTENLASTYLPFIGSDLRIAAPLILVFIALLFRPHGLFGTVQAERV